MTVWVIQAWHGDSDVRTMVATSREAAAKAIMRREAGLGGEQKKALQRELSLWVEAQGDEFWYSLSRCAYTIVRRGLITE